LTRFLSFSYLDVEKKKANSSLTLYTLSSKRHFFWVMSITKFWLIRLSIYLLHPQQEPHWLWRFSNMISSYPSVTKTRKIKNTTHTHTQKKNSFDGRLLHRSSFLTWQRHERTERTFTVKKKQGKKNVFEGESGGLAQVSWCPFDVGGLQTNANVVNYQWDTEREIAKSNGDLSTTSQRGGAGMVVGPVPLGQ
jgi:hypothetical protein